MSVRPPCGGYHLGVTVSRGGGAPGMLQHGKAQGDDSQSRCSMRGVQMAYLVQNPLICTPGVLQALQGGIEQFRWCLLVMLKK